MKSRRRESLAERASEYFDLPGGVVSNMPRIEISGGRQVLIERHRGVLEYSRELISVNTLKSVVHIRGEGLEIRAMTADELLISGSFFGIDFET
ncbi:MAG: sporulation protein [Clostridiales bacterium]|nr:sporulation protein [Clostridiales bacterium]